MLTVHCVISKYKLYFFTRTSTLLNLPILICFIKLDCNFKFMFFSTLFPQMKYYYALMSCLHPPQTQNVYSSYYFYLGIRTCRCSIITAYIPPHADGGRGLGEITCTGRHAHVQVLGVEDTLSSPAPRLLLCTVNSVNTCI